MDESEDSFTLTPQDAAWIREAATTRRHRYPEMERRAMKESDIDFANAMRNASRVPDELRVRESLIDALAIESNGVLKVEPTIPPSLRAANQYGATKVLVTVHTGDSVTIDMFGVPAAVALRVANLLGQILP